MPADRDAAEQQARYVREVVDQAPPLTVEQVQRLRGLLPAGSPAAAAPCESALPRQAVA